MRPAGSQTLAKHAKAQSQPTQEEALGGGHGSSPPPGQSGWLCYCCVDKCLSNLKGQRLEK